MAKTFGEKKVIKEMTIDEMTFNVTMDANGVTFVRKGDRHKAEDKVNLQVSWDLVLGAAEDAAGVEAEKYLGFQGNAYGKKPERVHSALVMPSEPTENADE